ncbi:MAG: tol-pal system-associated acyl-CoA thioesterase [Halieaceae bacterium]
MTMEFSLPIRVYIEDTDAGGIVYYVNYLKYLERARTEFMRSLGIHRAALSDDGWIFVVSHLSVSYLLPAKLDDEIMATAVVRKVGGATIDFEQTIRGVDNLLLKGEVQIACVDQASGRPRRLASDLRERLLNAALTEKDGV